MELAELITATKQSIRRVIQLHAAGLDEDTIISALVGEAMIGMADVPAAVETPKIAVNAKCWMQHGFAIGIPCAPESRVKVADANDLQYESIADFIDWSTVRMWRHV